MKSQNLIALLLSVLLLLSLTACGMREKATDGVKKNETPPDTGGFGSPALSQEPVGETAAGPFVWDSITFELTEVTEDLGEYAGQLEAPAGKYVLVVFTIADGQIAIGRLEELILTEQNITLAGHAPATIAAQGVAIENNLAYAVGTIDVFFDVPTELDAKNAEVIVNEDIPVP